MHIYTGWVWPCLTSVFFFRFISYRGNIIFTLTDTLYIILRMWSIGVRDIMTINIKSRPNHRAAESKGWRSTTRALIIHAYARIFFRRRPARDSLTKSAQNKTCLSLCAYCIYVGIRSNIFHLQQCSRYLYPSYSIST